MLRRDLNWFGHISSSGGISNAGAQCMSGQGQCDGSTGVATGQSEEELSVLPHNTEARYTAKQPAATEARYTAKQPAAAVIPHLDRRSAGQVAANHTGTSGHAIRSPGLAASAEGPANSSACRGRCAGHGHVSISSP